MHFKVVGPITDVEIIATGAAIRERGGDGTGAAQPHYETYCEGTERLLLLLLFFAGLVAQVAMDAHHWMSCNKWPRSLVKKK